MKTDSSWTFHPLPIDGEIFSSFLTRIAHAHGLSPYRFFSFHFPNMPIWNRDIDRSASDQFIANIARRCNSSPAALTSLTLRNFEYAFDDQKSLNLKRVNSVANWINAAGIFQRNRKRFSIQYCPHCLGASQCYKTIWRLSFVTACEHHECPLLDSCPHCGIQIVYHRTEAFHVNCHQCGRSLLRTAHQSIDSGELLIRLQIQAFLLRTAVNGSTFIGEQIVTSSQLFVGLTILLRVVKSALRSKFSQKIALPSIYANCLTERIELLRINERACQCMVIADLVSDWPNRFLEFSATHKITQVAFTGEPRIPAWLQNAVSTLAAGTTRPRHVEKDSLRNQLRNLHRHKKGNWRTERATLLLNKASS